MNQAIRSTFAIAALLLGAAALVFAFKHQPVAHAAAPAPIGETHFDLAYDSTINAPVVLAWNPATGQSTFYRYRYQDVAKPAEWVSTVAQLPNPPLK